MEKLMFVHSAWVNLAKKTRRNTNNIHLNSSVLCKNCIYKSWSLRLFPNEKPSCFNRITNVIICLPFRFENSCKKIHEKTRSSHINPHPQISFMEPSPNWCQNTLIWMNVASYINPKKKKKKTKRWHTQTCRGKISYASDT